MSEEQTTETEVASTEQTTAEETTTETTAATEESTSSTNETTTASDEGAVKEESTGEEAETTTTAETEETPTERVVPGVDDYVLPEGVPKQMAQFASDNDMTQEQFDNTLGYLGQYLKATTESQEKFLAEQGEARAESWGEQREYNLSLVRRALSQNDLNGELTNMLNSTGYGNHPAVLDFLLKIGNSMKEGGFIQGQVNRPTGKKTAAQTLFGATHPSVN